VKRLLAEVVLHFQPQGARCSASPSEDDMLWEPRPPARNKRVDLGRGSGSNH
jgi:hypothetical protein